MKTSVVICTNRKKKKKWNLALRICEICQNWISKVGFQNKSVFYPRRCCFQVLWNICSEKICSLSVTWWNSPGVVSLLIRDSAVRQWTRDWAASLEPTAPNLLLCCCSHWNCFSGAACFLTEALATLYRDPAVAQPFFLTLFLPRKLKIIIMN